MNPHQVTKDFEAALCEYTGAKHACVVTSCTMALLIACAYVRHCFGPRRISVPKRTYLSVPQSIIHAGHEVAFRDEDWIGAYELGGTNIWDSARRFRAKMFVRDQVQCVSFHASKTLSLEQGGALLSDNAHADAWYRRARFDGRTEGVDPLFESLECLGFHCYVSPSVSAQGLMKLSVLPKHNNDLPNSNYPDLSQWPIFGNSRPKKVAIAAE